MTMGSKGLGLGGVLRRRGRRRVHAAVRNGISPLTAEGVRSVLVRVGRRRKSTVTAAVVQPMGPPGPLGARHVRQ